MKEDEVYVKHILDSVESIGKYTEGVDREEFEENEMVQDAVIRQLEVIGEAAKQLSEEFRTRNSEVPWSDIAGMRDNLIHEYFAVDLDQVWRTLEKDLKELEEALR